MHRVYATEYAQSILPSFCLGYTKPLHSTQMVHMMQTRISNAFSLAEVFFI